MRVLLDENVPNGISFVLKKAGHDVEHINRNCKGMKDAEVLEFAFKNRRIIITFDSDFCKFKKKNHYGIIKVNGKLAKPEEPLLELLKQLRKTDTKDVYYQIDVGSAFKETKKYGKRRKTFLKNLYRTKIELECFQKV